MDDVMSANEGDLEERERREARRRKGSVRCGGKEEGERKRQVKRRGMYS